MVPEGSFWQLMVDTRDWSQLVELRSTGQPGAAAAPPEEADSTSKRKGRPGAAEVETTAEDIESSRYFRERRGWSAEAIYFRFLFA